MQKRGILFPISFFLLVVLISSNIHISKCLQDVEDCVEEKKSQSLDPNYEEIKQLLANEIDDVNDYMEMVADRLTNDGVIVVRAETIKFNTPEAENKSKIIIDLGNGDATSCCYPEETTILSETCAAAKTNESVYDDENQSSIDIKLMNEIEKTNNLENEEILEKKTDNMISTNLETEISS